MGLLDSPFGCILLVPYKSFMPESYKLESRQNQCCKITQIKFLQPDLTPRKASRISSEGNVAIL